MCLDNAGFHHHLPNQTPTLLSRKTHLWGIHPQTPTPSSTSGVPPHPDHYANLAAARNTSTCCCCSSGSLTHLRLKSIAMNCACCCQAQAQSQHEGCVRNAPSLGWWVPGRARLPRPLALNRAPADGMKAWRGGRWNKSRARRALQ